MLRAFQEEVGIVACNSNVRQKALVCVLLLLLKKTFFGGGYFWLFF